MRCDKGLRGDIVLKMLASLELSLELLFVMGAIDCTWVISCDVAHRRACRVSGGRSRELRGRAKDTYIRCAAPTHDTT